ncbi:hypothetical protein I8D64_12410 [Brachybacterium sp. MASK1Z-5]|uniref:Fis family transcriptional regulator n=1 Tax=Brachybacterium halotolerans TaxID=2795215 RepID=A0ABS1BC26_9MICO|nr:hypothetical protein [Brachybacterium halotolerans]MBK0332199.1 hypothetical protein [Brachybacterium halotolerans]
MSLERMFEDLESRMDHLESEERRAVTEELTRAERAQVLVLDRLRGAVGHDIRAHLRDGAVVGGEIVEVGADWVRLRSRADARSTWAVLGAIVLLEDLPDRVREPGSTRLRPPGLGTALRALARDRALVHVRTAAGEMQGRISGVGQDALDLRLLPSGEQRPASRARGVTILLSGILSLTAQRPD